MFSLFLFNQNIPKFEAEKVGNFIGVKDFREKPITEI
jgi:hypothetical protein